MDYGMIFWPVLRHLNDGFVSYKHRFSLHKMLTDGRVLWIIVMFLLFGLSF